MGELKSAWEIAQEKARKLGELSAEEQRQQVEERCHQIARAIIQRHFDQEGLDIATEIDNYPEGEKELIKPAILSYLTQDIDLRSHHRLERIAQGITKIEPGLQPITEQIVELAQEYAQAERKARQGIENKSRETLHQLRISGTAVGDINPEAKADWQETWHKFAQPFEQSLNNLKKGLRGTKR